MFCTKKRMGVVYILLSLELYFHPVEAAHEHISLQKKEGKQDHHPYNITSNHTTSPYGIVYEEELSPPMMYDTFYPVVFDVDVPNWNSTDLRVILPQEFSNVSKFCNDTSAQTDLWGASVCPIMNKLNDMLDDFYVELKMIESLNTSTIKGKHRFNSCHDIKPHFSHHIVDDEAIAVYILKALMDCPLKDIIHHSFSLGHVNQTKYTELLKDFFEIYVNPRYRMGGYVKYAASTNILISIHATELFEHLMYAYQWAASMATCNSQRIPNLFIDEDTMRSTLLEVQTKAQPHGLELTIPIDDLSSYYKLALADCAVTGSNVKSYLIRVLVPLTKIMANYKLVNLRSVPFLNTEMEDVPVICEHRTHFGSVVIQGNTHIPLAVPKCDDSKLLCRVPPVGDRPLFDRCVIDALFNRTKGIIDHCPLSCSHVDDSLLPYINRIKSDQFVIVGKSSAEIAIICGSDTKPLKVLEVPDNVGSLLVTIPCGCFIVHRTDQYLIEGECGLDLDILPVKAIDMEDILVHYMIPKDNSTTGDLEGKESSELDKEKVKQEAEFSNAIDRTISDAAGVVTWPMNWAFALSIIGIFCCVLLSLLVRNMYIRVGQLELAVAKNDRPNTEFHNMSFNVRAAADSDSVY